MLYDDPILHYRGLTIFKDFSDPRTFYFLPPEAPRIARSAEGGESGDYALRLVLFRPDPEATAPPQGMEDGGGFLNLDTDLHVSEGLLEDVREEIRRKFGTDANLVPVPFMNGSVELVLLGVSRDEEGQPFVRRVAGSTVPSLYGTQRAAFSTVLDRHGAALMKAVLQEGGVTMALAIYHLTYAGIPPAYNLKITIDYKRVFDHLDLRLRAGVSATSRDSSFVAKAGFHMLLQELKETRAIKVEEVDPIPGENGRTPTNQEMINEIIGNLMGSKWFKPSLTTVGQMTDLSGLVGGGAGSGSGSSSGGGPAASGAGSGAGTGAGTGAPRTVAAGTGPGPGAPGSGTGPSGAPTRQAATWTVDARENVSADRGVEEPFQPSASGTMETLVIRGTGATATVDGRPAEIQNNRLPVDVANGVTRNVVITWPGQAGQEDTFHLFFAFDQPENQNEVDAYSTGTPPPPGDDRFLNASQAKSASAPGGLNSLNAWLASRAGNTLRLRSYASYERDDTDLRHNQELSERRMEIAARTIERMVPNRFNSSDRSALGHVPAASGTVPTITPSGGTPDGHGSSSRPEHRVAIIYGPTQGPQSVLRGRLTRPHPGSGSGSGPGSGSGSGPGSGSGSGSGSGPGSGSGSGSGRGEDPTKIEASFEVNLEMIQQEEHLTATYELSTRKARTHEIHPQGQLILGAIDPSTYIIEADGAIEFFRWLDISASTTAQWALDGIHSILVQLRYGPRDDGRFQFTKELKLTPDQTTDGVKTGVLHENAENRRPIVYWYDYKVTVHYTDDVALGNQQGAVTSVGIPNADPDGWIRTDARNLVIHPRDITPAMTVNVATGVMQFDLLTKTDLALTYGPYRQNLALTADHPEHRLVIRPEPGLTGATLRTEGMLYYRDQARVPLPPQEWKPQELVVINEPRENTLRVRVILADPADEYVSAHVNLRYETADRVVEQSFDLKDHAEMKEWAIRLEDPTARRWSYEATLVKRSGDIDTIPMTEGKNQQLILGVQAVDVIPVQVAWLVPPPAGDLMAVQIDLAYEDAANLLRWSRSELIRQGHTGTFTWSIPIKDVRKDTYRYKVTEFRASGRKEGPWQDSNSTMLVLVPSS